jgi:site-specific DNA-adenine methylase
MKYLGGKGQTFQKLINLMPPHDVYIETHLGGGAVIRNKEPTKRNIGLEIDPKVNEMWSEEEKRGLEIIESDAVNYLKSYKFTGNEMIYCDPPYLRETRRRKRKFYKFEYTVEQHMELLQVIKTLPCMVMISGYESGLYKEMLKEWHIHTFQAKISIGVATEWLWMNYPAPSQLHDYRFLGDNFRQRERLKKKKENWVSRLKSMPVLERQALLFAIESMKEKK